MIRARLGVLVVAALVGSAGCTASRVPPADQPVFVGSSASSTPSVASASPSLDAAPTVAPSSAAAPAPSTGVRSPSVGAAVPGAVPTGTPAPVVDHGPRIGDKVALTFDADMTDAMLANLRSGRVRSYANLRILDLLERERVPATFFLTGKWVRRYPDVTRRIAGNPRFELANHTYGHAAFTRDCYDLPAQPVSELREDVARTFEVIAPYGGRQTRYFRFPGLCHDAAALEALAPLGVTVVDGDVVSGDPFARAWKPLVRAVLEHVRPGSVVIMHVTEANAPMTDEALPHILAGLRERGLVPAPLSEVLAGA
ncbi:polysaccharide deacetylase family protein [Micromonospora sp. WMMD1120]|uniref:polysaccharide deacetylase family protein n=1 Tax=Micromonospora sp. WMMD1120 TaxID=3016106 RepID=UPI0024163DDC|nr:polysaccharide deacetylase family protein [Micromonospora sp. WMMD1120]MDG4810039.1 polysaccharide deacetylase family protein [Micromonospora sp. WMMD1120]